MKTHGQPAMPLSLDVIKSIEDGYWYEYLGLTKLEYASIHIAAGISANPGPLPDDAGDVAAVSVALAKAVLEEANKQ